jgi:hypothetical protein
MLCTIYRQRRLATCSDGELHGVNQSSLVCVNPYVKRLQELLLLVPAHVTGLLYCLLQYRLVSTTGQHRQHHEQLSRAWLRPERVTYSD